MIIAAAVSLQVVAALGGVGIGALAVWLAQHIPPRMDPPVAGIAHEATWRATAVVVAAVFGWLSAITLGDWPLLAAYLAFGATTLAVTLTDLDHQLIPNRILFPGIGVSGVLLLIGSLISEVAGDLVRAAIAAFVYFALLLVVAVVARGGFGMGDVKLAILLGLFLGFAGWDALIVGFVLAILLGGVASIFLLIFTRKGRKAKFAYGPYLVAGGWIGLFWGSQIADWYLG